MIKDIKLSDFKNSNFVKTKRISYTQNDVEKTWDMVEVHDSVAILIYNKDKNSFVLVKQFRPPVYLKNEDGFTYELCAGIVDKKLSLEQIAIEEIDEECGYKVDRLEKITSFYTAVGFAGSKQTLFYAEVNDSMKIHAGGGIDVENIEVIFLHVEKAKEFILDESKAKTAGLMFAFMWWFDRNQNWHC